MPIRMYIPAGHAAFEPEAISAMCKALEKACATLELLPATSATEESLPNASSTWSATASDATALSDRVVAEAQALRSL